MDTAKAGTKRKILKRIPITQERMQQVYGEEHINDKNEPSISWCKLHELCGFHMGHSTLLREYCSNINLATEDSCHKCLQGAKTTSHIILDCAAMQQTRNRLNIWDLSDIVQRQYATIKLIRAFRLFNDADGHTDDAGSETDTTISTSA